MSGALIDFLKNDILEGKRKTKNIDPNDESPLKVIDRRIKKGIKREKKPNSK